MLLVEVRPQALGEVQFGVGALPEKKIAEAFFPAGADQKVDFRRGARGMVHLVQQAMKAWGTGTSGIFGTAPK